ncbi:glycosyltransferase [Chlorobium sp. BLA1]|uniref:glycosyltransferase n=1 Tax=Candidatus Chlorobium masyuteum TaxID=2716876 RepID=UPI001420A91E|nr:glycosyltransferase [Candidatus Chlorobium masyuteum]NHQ59891.1 glycosyltransferase [Candidatus Chlorobium masyuteum]NTU44739.1 glycosyltransferase [Chlorobiaceae bacterium]
MKISAFTFIKNGTIFGFPYTESIRSVLPIVDEFVVNVGLSDDDTLERIRAINDPKIRIIESHWNDRMKVGGYVYGQQKMIAQFNCTGDWAFYLEGDEIVHEEELRKIVEACRTHLDDERIEALTFDYYHFYGNANSYLDSPGWYRRAARIIRNSIRTTAPDGLFWHVLTDNNKVSRYPRSAHTGASIYHYGWVRSEAEMNRKSENVQKYWNKNHSRIDYGEIDQKIVREFKGSHPAIIRDWLPKEEGLFRANPGHTLTRREKKHRFMLHLERWFGMELSKKHFDPVTRE